MELDMHDEMQELESRIQAICKTMEEDPKQAKYLQEDLHYFEEELQMLRVQENLKSLKQAKRRIGDNPDTSWAAKKVNRKWLKGGEHESE
jgi:hypothetical protein